ncbi:hypothetical protein MNV_450006 [Candidatus Methanoperedens nitroreducens]|uniref:Uncharacterized protein n=1 Tax=Candidatus Methanoperedens nitratireducens TaxID=1392998 RepID=A0A284VQU9_9EURY|nr:hypothetical protein MNV_450006 [Candidatus Methanoperedens nitroreducens]
MLILILFYLPMRIKEKIKELNESENLWIGFLGSVPEYDT